MEWAGVVAGSGVAGSILTKFFGRKRDNAETIKVLADAAVVLISPLEQRITQLEESDRSTKLKLHETESRLSLAVNHIQTLYTWISANMPNHVPPKLPEGLAL